MTMFKKILIQMTPPLIFSLARKVKRSLRIGRPIYERLYFDKLLLPQFEENPFEHPNWLAYVEERAESRKNGVTAQDFHEIALSLLASISSPAVEQDQACVVDFGGGGRNVLARS